MRKLLGIILALLSLTTVMPTAEAAKADKGAKTTQPSKERLVLMPMRLSVEDKSLQGAMETALVEGLQLQYEVFSGEQVAQKAHEIFLKESRSTAKKECDETRCMQGIAEAFQAELIATANVTKREDGYFLALSIQNIFDNKVVYSKSTPCKNCDAYRVVNILKELGAGLDITAKAQSATENSELNTSPQQVADKANDSERTLWAEVHKGNKRSNYQAYLDKYPNGLYAVLARKRIKKLQDEIESEAKRNEQELWNVVEAGQDAKIVQEYIDRYPNGSHLSEAQDKLQAIKKADVEHQPHLPEQPKYVSQGGHLWMPITFAKTWEEAKNYCEKTAINGQTGWSLPSKEQLIALFQSGAMNGQGWTLSATWVSSIVGYARHSVIYLNNGSVDSDNDWAENYVTCVR